MALTQISTKGIKDGTITNADLGASAAIAGTKISPDFGSQNITTTGNIDCASDTNKVRLGASQDFTFEHNGTINKILSAGNRLIISGSSADNVDIMHTQSEFMAKFIPNGAVELYHDNSKKFETTSSGVTVSGGTVANGHITLPDHTGSQDGKLRFGASTDLEIYHDGSNSYIKDAGTGSLLIRGSTVSIQSVSGEAMIEGVADGAVTIKHDNSTKFETHSGGVNLLGSGTDAIQMTGDVWFNNNEHAGADIYFNSGEKHLIYEDGVRAKFGGGGDLEIIHDGTNSRITNITNDLRIESDRIELNNQASNEFYLTCTANGAVELYYNNSKKAFTYSDGLHIDTGILRGDDNAKIVLGDSSDLQIYHNGTVSFIQDAGTGGIAVITNDFAVNNAADTEQMIRAIEDQGVFLFYNGSIKFQTLNGGVQVDGNLAFGANNCQIQTGSSGHMVAIQGGATNMGGRIEFRGGNSSGDIRMYAQGATSTQVERMRIKPDGQVLFNTTSSIGSGVLNIDIGGVSSAAILDVGARIQSHENGNHAFHFQNTSGTTVGKVIINSGSTTYSTSSDYRVKENVVAISDGITRLKTLKPYRFNFINDKSTTVDGFFAHEVTAVPEAINGTKDETQDILYTEEDTIPPGKEVGDVKETIPVYQGIDQSKLVPLLVAALQEAITKIEVIQTEVAALKAS